MYKASYYCDGCGVEINNGGFTIEESKSGFTVASYIYKNNENLCEHYCGDSCAIKAFGNYLQKISNKKQDNE